MADLPSAYDALALGFSARTREVGMTAVQLPDAPNTIIRGITVKACRDNTTMVLIGSNANVPMMMEDGAANFPLYPGEETTIQIDDPTKIWVIADAPGQLVHWIGAG